MTGVDERGLKRLGQDVDLVLKTKTGEDDFGEDYSESTNSGVKAVVRRRTSSAEPIRDASGNEVEADAEVFVHSSTTGLTGGGNEGATEIDVDQDGNTEYLVYVVDDQDSGIIRLVSGRINA